MKKFLYPLLFLFCFTLNAQEKPKNDKESSIVEQNIVYARDINKNELSLNILNLVVFGTFDARYERILTDHSSLGFDVFLKLVKVKNDDVAFGFNFDLKE